jgi:hypothetical protein
VSRAWQYEGLYVTTTALAIAFNGVLVVESLRQGDDLTGKSLVEYVQDLAVESDAGFPIGRISCRTSVEFESLLGQLTEEASLYGKWPWLHLEMHGSAAQGIYFEDESNIEWVRVAELFTTLNLATHFNLGVSFATCHGAEFFRKVSFLNPSPMLMAVGPTDGIYPDEVMSRYRSFYRALAKTRDFEAGVQALQEIPLTQGTFIADSATNWFADTCLLRIRNYCLPSAVEKRAKGMVKQMKKRGTSLSRGIIRRELEIERDGFIDKSFRMFFMTESLPENVSRFASVRRALSIAVKKELSGRY